MRRQETLETKAKKSAYKSNKIMYKNDEDEDKEDNEEKKRKQKIDIFLFFFL